MTTPQRTPEHAFQEYRPLGEPWDYDTTPGDPRHILVASTAVDNNLVKKEPAPEKRTASVADMPGMDRLNERTDSEVNSTFVFQPGEASWASFKCGGGPHENDR